MADCKKDDRRGSAISGFIILGVGLYFLAVNLRYIPSVGDSWPVFLVIVGAALILGNLFRNRRRDDSDMSPPNPGA
jgi:hypothetical protein